MMDATEIVTVLVVGAIAVSAMFLLGVEGKEIGVASVSGLIGYLTRAAQQALKKKPPDLPPNTAE